MNSVPVRKNVTRSSFASASGGYVAVAKTISEHDAARTGKERRSAGDAPRR